MIARLRSLDLKGEGETPYSEISLDEARQQHEGDSDLSQMFFQHGGRLVHKWVHYLPAYERHFSRYRSGVLETEGERRSLRLLEIGVGQGGSLQLWRRFFGPEAVIYGIDIDSRCESISDDDLPVRIGSQGDPAFLRSVVAEMGGIDIVVDDGNHRAPDQRIAFSTLFPLLSLGGLYVVEDLHASYWPSHGGGYRRRGTFIEIGKDLVDGMHGWYYHRTPPRRGLVAKTDISSICFHDSIVFIEKALRSEPLEIMVGDRAL